MENTGINKLAGPNFFEGDVAYYACLNWPHHILLGFQEQGLNLDETIMTSLATLIGSLLNFKGKTWYNTMLTFILDDRRRMLSCVRDGKTLFQVSYCSSQGVIMLLTYTYKTLQESIITKNLIKILQQVIDLYEVRIYT